MSLNRSAAFKIGQLISHIVLMLFSLAAILPFLLMAMASITDEKTLFREGYSFFPSKLSFYAYEYLFVSNATTIFRAYGVTMMITIVGTSLCLLFAPMFGYALSRKDNKKRGVLTFFVFFTMLFNGGLVPQYLMYTQMLNIKNSFWALIVPNLLMNGFIILLMKSYFVLNIHPALIEAAKIDGAREFYIYRRIVMPLSLPILATIGLMNGIAYWNDWMNGLYYITDPRLYSLQNLLNRILMSINFLKEYGTAAGLHMDIPTASVRLAMTLIGTLPILVLYPFFQKFFVKGISLGGIKG
ncbi:MAG: carbohydrate ABC transporter permease [Saccharofermentanales bacterium]|jgi:putative aldouronate transport system permease protein|nr:carbohydrate ABC transporter permease [Clostridiaceae bacterium]